MRGVALAIAASLLCGSALLAEKKSSQPITKPKFDPSAESVKMFDGIDNGKLDVKMIPGDAMKGNLLIENKTGKPLTVEMPDAFVGVQVLKQFGGGGMGRGGGGGMTGGGGGGGQSVGGGGGGMGMGGGGGGGYFSVPADKPVRVPYQSVCLEHGKADPNSRMTYRPIRVEEFTDNKALQELITTIGTQKVDLQVAQAAAWNLSNNVSWQDLAAKAKSKLGGRFVPYFTPAQLAKAEQMVSTSIGKARERKDDEKSEEKPVVETRKPLAAR